MKLIEIKDIKTLKINDNPIIFRGKSIRDGKTYYGLLHMSFDGKWLIRQRDEFESLEYFNTDEVDPKTIGMYIGYEDRNGNSIFHGMVVEYDDYKWTVIRTKGGGAWLERGLEWFADGSYDWVDIHWERCEILNEYDEKYATK